MPELDEAIRKLGEAVHSVRTARSFILADLRKLYPDEAILRRLGEYPWASEMIELVRGDLERGRIGLRDAKDVCTPRGCTDAARFLERSDDYYKASGERAKAMRGIERLIL